MAAVHVPLAAEKVFSLGPVPITNSIIFTWLVTIVLLAFAYFATRKIQRVPQGLQNIAEIMVDGLYNLVSSIAPPDKTKAFLPIIATFFFFILFGNYLGLLPGVGSIGFYLPADATHQALQAGEEHHAISETRVASTEPVSQETNEQSHENTSGSSDSSETSDSSSQKVFVPYLRAMNSDLNTTMALAIVSVIITHYFAIKYLGLGSYIGKFLSLNPIFLFVGLLELFGELTKIASLSFRLFGNIFAGEVLLTTATTSIFAYIAPIPFYFLEFLVAFVQALIFSMLTLVFMVILTEKHAEH